MVDNKRLAKYFLIITILMLISSSMIILTILLFPEDNYSNITEITERFNLFVTYVELSFDIRNHSSSIIIGFVIFGIALVITYVIPCIMLKRNTEKLKLVSNLNFYGGIYVCVYLLGLTLASIVHASVSTDPYSFGALSSPNLSKFSAEIQTIYSKANNLLCSDKCPCSFNWANHYKKYSDARVEQLFWSNTAGTSQNIQSCPEKEKQAIWDSSVKNLNSFKRDTVFAFLGRVEKHFQCTGWHDKKYFTMHESVSIVERGYVRYLFAGLDYEPFAEEENNGCLRAVVSTVKKYFIVFSIVTGVSFIVNLFIILKIRIVMSRYIDEEDNRI